MALPGLTPVSKWLLVANLVIFLIDFFSRKGGSPFGIINERLFFSVQSAFLEGKIWEVFTFQFLHANPWHLIGNSVGLYFFGPWAERWWGSQRFLVFYLLCGIAGALFFSLLMIGGVLPSSGISSRLIGASAGIYGILISVAVINPKERLMLLFPRIEMTMKKLALIFLGIAVVVIIGDNLVGGRPFENSGGEAGHLGGAILAYFLTRFPHLLRKKGKDAESKIIRPKEFRKRRGPAKLRPRSSVDVATASDVDRILDKISRDGIQSLTDEEREILQKASKPTKER
ncbi:rhomboid family intramembrane serine protease [Luteolibacter flavescens]|nr:rhomboid family intramembrane serine protease [Luteolibacter flavescens]